MADNATVAAVYSAVARYLEGLQDEHAEPDAAQRQFLSLSQERRAELIEWARDGSRSQDQKGGTL